MSPVDRKPKSVYKRFERDDEFRERLWALGKAPPIDLKDRELDKYVLDCWGLQRRLIDDFT